MFRITTRMMTDNAMANLNANLKKLSKTQNKISTGKQISVPSDDPAGASRTLGYQDIVATNEQYISNIDDGMSWLGFADSALSSTTDLLQRARELAVSAGGASLTGQERAQIAQEVDELLSEAVQVSNSTYGDQHIFGGFKTTNPPFSINAGRTAVTYNGDSGLILRETEPNSTTAVNVPGNKVFTNVFTSLIQLRDDLNANNEQNISTTDITNLDTAMNNVLDNRSTVGARYNRMDSAKSRLGQYQLNIQQLLSTIRDVDLPKAITDLSMQQSVYQASLVVSAKTIQPSLLDFLH